MTQGKTYRTFVEWIIILPKYNDLAISIIFRPMDDVLFYLDPVVAGEIIRVFGAQACHKQYHIV
jgi:hypothetical protein